MDKIDSIKTTPDYHSDQAIMNELLQLESRLDEIIRTTFCCTHLKITHILDSNQKQ